MKKSKEAESETPFSRFERFMKKLVAVPKTAVEKRPIKRFPLAKKDHEA